MTIRPTWFLAAAAALALAPACSKKQDAETPAPAPAETAEAEPEAAAPTPTPTCADPSPEALAQLKAAMGPALAGEHRSDDNKARDAARHPAETLGFFGLTPDMKVLELWAGGGWYTEVLAPVLAEAGELSVSNFDPEGDERFAKYGKRLTDKLQADAATYGKVKEVYVAPPDKLDLGDGQYDMVLTFRNNHSWIGGGYEDKVYQAALKALKPCGIFGVVQHRAKADATEEQWKGTGYVPQDYLIAKIQTAGFELVDKSEVNANPKDTKDHPNGVWTLPPGLNASTEEGKEATDEQKAPYIAIGESDRMTLKFRKPAAK